MGDGTAIPWRQWGPEAFDEARRTGKPVLLDLSAVWCHWCHVMDDTSYSDERVVELIREHFIPVRVDIDRRPDIRDRYSVFGGWPTTAFLNHRGEIVTGGTYIPPEQMRRVLPQVKEYFDRHGGDPPVQLRLRPEETPGGPAGAVGPGIVEEVLGHILIAFDEVHGGLGTEPKFPHSDAVDLVLAAYGNGGNRQLLAVATKTLDALAASALRDPVEGGFFRYSVTADWSVPHYEKMCDVNAGLLRNYARAYAVAGRERYRAVAEEILRYVGGTLADPRGGFYGSQDADEEYYGLGDLGARRARRPPAVDTTLYADLNGMMAHAHLEAAGLLGHREAAERALRALDRVLREHRAADGSLLHFPDPSAPRDLLADHAWLARGLIAAFEATGDGAHLVAAEALVDRALARLRTAGGPLRDRPVDGEEIGYLARGETPIQENAVMADVLLRLAEARGNEAYRRAAAEILGAFAGEYDRYGYFASAYASAVDLLLRGVVKVVLVGHGGGEAAGAHAQLLALPEPRKLVVPLADGRAYGFPASPSPAVYVCAGERCSPPLPPGPDLSARLHAFLAGPSAAPRP